MKIIVPRIPRTTTRSDLKRFVQAGLQRKFRLSLIGKPRIVSCEILRVEDAIGSIERHGLVTVEPDKAAPVLVRGLHGGRLNGKRVGARFYVKRKAQGIGFEPAFNRRRLNLQIEKEIAPAVEGYIEFAREIVL